MDTDYTEFEAADSQTGLGDAEMVSAYGSSREYLDDELKRLDLLLRLHIAREQQNETPNQFAGMALSAEEVYGLLGGDSPYGCDEGLLYDELVQLDNLIYRRRGASEIEGVYLSLPYISKMLNLSLFEERCIIICLAPELERKYEKVYAYFQNDISLKSPGVDFVLQILTQTEEEKTVYRPVFDQQASLMRLLMETGGNSMEGSIPLIARSLKLDDWIVNFLLGYQVLDARLSHVANLIPANGIHEDILLTDIHEKVARFVNYYWGNNQYGAAKTTKQIFHFYGPDGAGKKTHVKATCQRLGLPLMIADVEKMLSSEIPFNELLRLLGRQIMLENMVLCLESFDSLLAEDGRHQVKLNMLLQMVTTFAPLTFVLGLSLWSPRMPDNETTFIAQGFSFPEESQRRIFWENFSREYKLSPEVDINAFAAKFRFTPGQILGALNRGESLAVWSQPEYGVIGPAELYNACYTQSNRQLGTLAPKINVMYSFDMLVLPYDQMSQLKEICNQIKYRNIVYKEWGFDGRLSLGKGLNVLFSGPPGSGKTMAAEVIANDLNLEIYKIDVSQIVSKYIGETEKNLGRIFEEAETSNAILFFDEADALFGKRSEVKDAHDRYANVETSYLLQKMEEYSGVVILATNFSQNMDEAFLRRLHFSVEFPFPEKEQRKEIWQGIFPAGAPLSSDLDYDFISEKFVLAGGNIKNIALSAAFYAARDSCEIGMKQIMMAAKREYQKLSKTFLRTDFEPYYQLIEVN